jgi:hypothetical protein
MAGNPMDQRIESFLADVLALAGEEPDVVRDEVRVALGDYEAIFRAHGKPPVIVLALFAAHRIFQTADCVLQETNKRMRDNAALVCRALCRARVVAEMHQRRGTQIAEHLKLVLTIIDRRVH